MKRKVLISVLTVALVLTLCIGLFVACDKTPEEPATQYKVTFSLGDYDGTDAEPPADQTVDAGSKIQLPAVGVTWADHTFLGWQLNGEGETLAANAEVTVNSDLNYIAKWQEDTEPLPKVTIYYTLGTELKNVVKDVMTTENEGKYMLNEPRNYIPDAEQEDFLAQLGKAEKYNYYYYDAAATDHKGQAFDFTTDFEATADFAIIIIKESFGTPAYTIDTEWYGYFTAPNNRGDQDYTLEISEDESGKITLDLTGGGPGAPITASINAGMAAEDPMIYTTSDGSQLILLEKESSGAYNYYFISKGTDGKLTVTNEASTFTFSPAEKPEEPGEVTITIYYTLGTELKSVDTTDFSEKSGKYALNNEPEWYVPEEEYANYIAQLGKAEGFGYYYYSETATDHKGDAFDYNSFEADESFAIIICIEPLGTEALVIRDEWFGYYEYRFTALDEEQETVYTLELSEDDGGTITLQLNGDPITASINAGMAPEDPMIYATANGNSLILLEKNTLNAYNYYYITRELDGKMTVSFSGRDITFSPAEKPVETVTVTIYYTVDGQLKSYKVEPDKAGDTSYTLSETPEWYLPEGEGGEPGDYDKVIASCGIGQTFAYYYYNNGEKGEKFDLDSTFEESISIIIEVETFATAAAKEDLTDWAGKKSATLLSESESTGTIYLAIYNEQGTAYLGFVYGEDLNTTYSFSLEAGDILKTEDGALLLAAMDWRGNYKYYQLTKSEDSVLLDCDEVQNQALTTPEDAFNVVLFKAGDHATGADYVLIVPYLGSFDTPLPSDCGFEPEENYYLNCYVTEDEDEEDWIYLGYDHDVMSDEVWIADWTHYASAVTGDWEYQLKLDMASDEVEFDTTNESSEFEKAAAGTYTLVDGILTVHLFDTDFVGTASFAGENIAMWQINITIEYDGSQIVFGRGTPQLSEYIGNVGYTESGIALNITKISLDQIGEDLAPTMVKITATADDGDETTYTFAMESIVYYRYALQHPEKYGDDLICAYQCTLKIGAKSVKVIFALSNKDNISLQIFSYDMDSKVGSLKMDVDIMYGKEFNSAAITGDDDYYTLIFDGKGGVTGSNYYNGRPYESDSIDAGTYTISEDGKTITLNTGKSKLDFTYELAADGNILILKEGSYGDESGFEFLTAEGYTPEAPTAFLGYWENADASLWIYIYKDSEGKLAAEVKNVIAIYDISANGDNSKVRIMLNSYTSQGVHMLTLDGEKLIDTYDTEDPVELTKKGETRPFGGFEAELIGEWKTSSGLALTIEVKKLTIGETEIADLMDKIATLGAENVARYTFTYSDTQYFIQKGYSAGEYYLKAADGSKTYVLYKKTADAIPQDYYGTYNGTLDDKAITVEIDAQGLKINSVSATMTQLFEATDYKTSTYQSSPYNRKGVAFAATGLTTSLGEGFDGDFALVLDTGKNSRDYTLEINSNGRTATLKKQREAIAEPQDFTLAGTWYGGDRAGGNFIRFEITNEGAEVITVYYNSTSKQTVSRLATSGIYEAQIDYEWYEITVQEDGTIKLEGFGSIKTFAGTYTKDAKPAQVDIPQAVLDLGSKLRGLPFNSYSKEPLSIEFAKNSVKVSVTGADDATLELTSTSISAKYNGQGTVEENSFVIVMNDWSEWSLSLSDDQWRFNCSRGSFPGYSSYDVNLVEWFDNVQLEGTWELTHKSYLDEEKQTTTTIILTKDGKVTVKYGDQGDYNGTYTTSKANTITFRVNGDTWTITYNSDDESLSAVCSYSNYKQAYDGTYTKKASTGGGTEEETGEATYTGDSTIIKTSFLGTTTEIHLIEITVDNDTALPTKVTFKYTNSGEEGTAEITIQDATTYFNANIGTEKPAVWAIEIDQKIAGNNNLSAYLACYSDGTMAIYDWTDETLLEGGDSFKKAE